MSHPPATTHGHSTALNALLAALCACIGIWSLWLLPLMLPQHPLAAWSLVAVALFTTTWWSVIHEAIHGLLFPKRAVNDAAGRALALLFGLPFQPVAFGHLFHHRRNRSRLDRAEVYPKNGSRFRAGLDYYTRLLGGLYLAESALWLLVWLPRPRLMGLVARRFDGAGLPAEGKLLQRRVLDPEALRDIRFDAAGVLLCLGSSLSLYGRHAWLLVMLLLGRGLLLSLMDNAYHYGTPLDAPRYALNLGLPRPLSALILHFNLHRQHHLHPATSWRELPRLFAEAKDRYDGSYHELALRQLRG
ncbi:MAG TPA: fatty acid desaturase, partial [Gammaproteobacteria bacterium]|nr:fatty acid desaturase [Gammaproteobacteria bacterium]